MTAKVVSTPGSNVRTSAPCAGSHASDDHTFVLPCWMYSSCGSAPTSRVHGRFDVFLILNVIRTGWCSLAVAGSGTGVSEISVSAHGPAGPGAPAVVAAPVGVVPAVGMPVSLGAGGWPLVGVNSGALEESSAAAGVPVAVAEAPLGELDAPDPEHEYVKMITASNSPPSRTARRRQ